MAVQLLLAERTHICSVCVADDHCELQAMANQLGVDHVMFERNWSHDEIDSTHDFLVIDRNRCILCTRCIRVCDQIEGVHTLDLKLRGKDSQVIMDLRRELGQSMLLHFLPQMRQSLPRRSHLHRRRTNRTHQEPGYSRIHR